jgi:tripartite-type tricarboxylate transporter receptor subunit TctC
MARSMLFVNAVLTAVLYCLVPPAAAQSRYPEKPIMLVVPYSPGASSDTLGRLTAQALSKQLDMQVVVVNKPGAVSKIGTEFVAKSANDGYTLLFNSSTLITNPALYAELGYDPIRDFSPVSEIGTHALIFVVPPTLPVTNIQEFVAYAKQNPGKIAYGSAGTGNGTHLAAKLFFDTIGINALHVPYSKGGSLTIVDVISGSLQFYAGSGAAVLAFIRNERVKPLAVASLKRLPVLPDVPTVHETVIPNFEAGLWQGIVAPAGTPPAIVRRLNREIVKFLKEPGTLAKFDAEGIVTVGSTPEEYGAFLKSEMERWGKVIRDAGIKPE